MSSKPSPDLPSAALVIPTWNGAEELARTLAAVRAARGGETLPILIVDSGSEDRTRDIAESYGARVATIPPGTFNHGGTRNLGISLCEGEIAILMTQDAVPADEAWLERLLAPFEDGNVAGVFACQVAPDDAPERAKAEQDYADGSSGERVTRSLGDVTAWFTQPAIERYRAARFDNVCSAVRRNVWERVPFAMAPYGEDIDWGHRVLLAGYRIVYEPACQVWHAHERPAHYIYKRMLADHHLLAETFRLLTIPAWWYVPRAVYGAVLHELRLAWRSKATGERFRRMWSAVGLGLASSFGQYRGARQWRTGRARHAEKGV